MLKRCLFVIVLLCAVFCSAAGSLFAARVPARFLPTEDPVWQKTLATPVTGEFRDAELEVFLSYLSRVTGARIIPEFQESPDVPAPRITVSLRGIALKEVLYFISVQHVLDFQWKYPADGKKAVPEGISVSSAAGERKRLVRQTWLAVVAVFFLVYVMVVVVFRKKPRVQRTLDVEEVKNLSEEEVILKMFSDKQNDFIFQILAIDRFSRSDSPGAVIAIINSLKNPDPLVRKVAFSKLKIKYRLEDIITDFSNVTEEQVEKVRSLIIK